MENSARFGYSTTRRAPAVSNISSGVVSHTLAALNFLTIETTASNFMHIMHNMQHFQVAITFHYPREYGTEEATLEGLERMIIDAFILMISQIFPIRII